MTSQAFNEILEQEGDFNKLGDDAIFSFQNISRVPDRLQKVQIFIQKLCAVEDFDSS